VIFAQCSSHHHHTTAVLRPFFWDHAGELVPEENFSAMLNAANEL